MAIDLHRIAKVSASQRDAEPTITWNMEALSTVGIHPGGVNDAVSSTGTPRAGSTIQWCL